MRVFITRALSLLLIAPLIMHPSLALATNSGSAIQTRSVTLTFGSPALLPSPSPRVHFESPTPRKRSRLARAA